MNKINNNVSFHVISDNKRIKMRVLFKSCFYKILMKTVLIRDVNRKPVE